MPLPSKLFPNFYQNMPKTRKKNMGVIFLLPFFPAQNQNYLKQVHLCTHLIFMYILVLQFCDKITLLGTCLYLANVLEKNIELKNTNF